MPRRQGVGLIIVSLAAAFGAQREALPGWRFIRPDVPEVTLWYASSLGRQHPTVLHPRDSLWVIRCTDAWCTFRATPDQGDTLYVHSEDLTTRQGLVAYYSRKGWTPQQVRAVVAQRVLVGMTEDMVAAAWGPPSNITDLTTASGTTTTRYYGVCAWVQFRLKRVVAVHDCR